VRELKNFLERLLLLSPEPEIRPEDVRKQSSPSPGIPLPAFESAFYKVSRRQVLDQFDRAFVEKALAHHDGNVSAAAQEAGIERQYFHKIMKRFGIRGEEFRAKLAGSGAI
jgi:DNA-binding NtrC family response regulator